MFILVVVGIVHSHLNVSEEHRTVRKFPDFLFCLLVGVISRFLQGVKEATIKNSVGKDNVGHKHFKMVYYTNGFYLGIGF
jgi:Na+/glutamate symporter